MSVLIEGMEMPTSCSECGQFRWNNFLQSDVCRIAEAIGYDGIFQSENEGIDNRPSWCPLVPIPPHGRLIDADAPIKVWEVKLSDGGNCSFRNIETTVSKFLLSHLMGEVPPTIIEAEGEE